MIPDVELDRFSATVSEALELGSRGRVAEGYLCLDLGLLWAETPPFDVRAAGWLAPDPWSEELGDHYRRALMGYAREFGLTAEHVLAAHIHLSAGELLEFRPQRRAAA